METFLTTLACLALSQLTRPFNGPSIKTVTQMSCQPFNVNGTPENLSWIFSVTALLAK